MADIDQGAGTSARKPTPMSAATAADQGATTNTPPDAANADGSTPNADGTTASNTTNTADQGEAASKVDARILRDHLDYRANSFAQVTDAEAKLGEGDWLDTNADAVAYVKSLSA